MSHDDHRLADAFRTRLDDATRLTPVLPTPQERVHRARHALRRHRATRAVASVAAVAVIGTGAAWAVDGVSGDRAVVDTAGQTEEAAGDPCPTLPTEADPATTRIRLPPGAQEPTQRVDIDARNEPVGYGSNGDISAAPGFRVRQHVAGPGNTDRSGWDAVEVEGSNGRFFQMSSYSDFGRAGSSTLFYEVTPRRPSLQQWITYHFDVTGGPADIVDMEDDGIVVGHEGVEVTELRTVSVPGFDFRARQTAARVRQGDDECYVLATRSVDGTDARIQVVPPEYAGDDLDEFVRLAAVMRRDPI